MSELSGAQTIGDVLGPKPTPVAAPTATPVTGLPPVSGLPAAPTPQGPRAIAAEMIDGVDLDPYIKALIYSESGAGKTKFAATWPKPLIIDTENSTETLRDWPELTKNAKIIRLKQWGDLDEILEALRCGDPEFADRETLVIDTITELQSRNLSELLEFEAARNSARDPFLAHQQDYKKSGEMLRRITTAFRDLPMHMVVNAHSTEDNVNGNLTLRPDLTPKLAKTMKGVFGIQGFLFVTDEGWDGPFTNCLQTRRNAVVQAKSRYRHLPPIVENPTFDIILEASTRYLLETSATEAEGTATNNPQGVTL